MKRALEKATKFFDIPLDLRSRVLILVAAVLVLPALFTPLWQVTFQSSRYPDGLKLNVYCYKLEGGTESDLLEINILNHDMGMRSLEEEEFLEFRWLPFVLGAVLLLALRAIVLGKMSKLVDLFFLTAYAGIFALWSFANNISTYGHSINDSAPVKIESFAPPLFGGITVGNVDVYSLPGPGTYCLVLVPLILLAAIFLAHRTQLRDQQPKKDYIG